MPKYYVFDSHADDIAATRITITQQAVRLQHIGPHPYEAGRLALYEHSLAYPIMPGSREWYDDPKLTSAVAAWAGREDEDPPYSEDRLPTPEKALMRAVRIMDTADYSGWINADPDPRDLTPRQARQILRRWESQRGGR